MKLQAWRSTIPNPSDDPLVVISIAPVDKAQNVFPWVLPVKRAEEIFGKHDIDKIGKEAQQVFLTLTVEDPAE
jgi:hypothetical protein